MFEASEKRIGELNRELDASKAGRDRLNEEARKRAEEQNLLREGIEKLRLEAQTLKEKRDALNNEVQHLKTLREEAWKRYYGNIDGLKRLRQMIREATSRKPGRSFQSLENVVKKIEWKIQTESLPVNEERKLVDQVKILESQLEVYREIERIAKKIDMLENEARKSKDEVLTHRKRILEVAKQSQGFHEKMVERLEKIKKLKIDADEKHKEYVSCQQKAKALHSKYVEVLGQINTIRDEVRAKEEEERAKQKEALRKTLEKEALNKLKRGERLTFEEFKVLAEKGKI